MRTNPVGDLVGVFAALVADDLAPQLVMTPLSLGPVST
jgi:hypothetical protein